MRLDPRILCEALARTERALKAWAAELARVVKASAEAHLRRHQAESEAKGGD